MWSVAASKCVGICEGHTMAVGGVAWPKRGKVFHEGQSPWLVTGSKDRTLKVSMRVLACEPPLVLRSLVNLDLCDTRPHSCGALRRYLKAKGRKQPCQVQRQQC